MSLNVLVREKVAEKMAEEHEKEKGKYIAFHSEEFEY